jgi:hypothetical protein
MHSNRSPVPLQPLGTLSLTAPTQNQRQPFIAAASGLVRHGNYFFVVADDELQLGIFSMPKLQLSKIPSSAIQPGTMWPLLPGQLPLEPTARKRVKPDFEALTLLPPTSHWPHGALLILGSGSTLQRNRAVLLTLDAQGLPAQMPPLLLDFTPLYSALAREFGIVNIEGATTQYRNNVGQLLLLQRGNSKNGSNAIVYLDLAKLLVTIASINSGHTEIGASVLRDIELYSLGAIDGVALSFTDATCLPDQQLLALAVAEDTDDAYTDGATLGSCLCRFDRDNRLLATIPLTNTAKTEGIAVWQHGPGLDTLLAFVTDADDPSTAAQLSIAALAAFD